jgi:hypothetical protein
MTLEKEQLKLQMRHIQQLLAESKSIAPTAELTQLLCFLV